MVKLGDAWMDVEIPNQAAHQAMDTMMGGDGSQSLDQAHAQMAERYLGCQVKGSSGYSWMPMMFGYHNTSSGGSTYFPMMGYGFLGSRYGIVGRILGGLFGLVALVDGVLLGIFLWKQIRK